jgi:hypothetical protein
VRLWAIEYLEFLSTGRGPGKHPPPDDMRDWVRTKLGITEESPQNAAAFLTGRKIAQEGTAIFKDNSKGIEFEEKLEAMIIVMKKEILLNIKGNILNRIRKNKPEFIDI